MSYKLLFIDDDSSRAEGLREALERAGHGLLISADADEGLRALDQYRPDLVVIGSNLPGKTAAELCREINETTNAEKIPIVIVGDQTDPESISQLAQSGCDQIIESPVTAKRLIQVCGELLESTVTDETVPANSSEDGRLDADELLSAMGQFESILEEDDEDEESESTESSTRSQAAARGDFSELLDEVNVDQPPCRNEGNSTPVAPPETDDELSLESELGRAFDAVTEEEPAQTTDEGQDIADHLDTLFSGRGAFDQSSSDAAPTTTPTAPTAALEQDRVEPTPSTPEPSHEVLAPTNALKTTQPMAIQTEIASPAPEPIEPTAQPVPVASTSPAPAAHELFDPAEPQFAPSSERRKRSGATWWIAAGFAIVVLAGGALLLFMRDGGSSNSAPVDSVTVGVTSSSLPAPGPTAPPAENSPPDAGVTEETDSNPASKNASPESRLPTKPSGTTTPRPPLEPTPRPATTRAATMPDRKTTAASSTAGRTAKATPVAATPKPTKAAATNKPAATTPDRKTTAASSTASRTARATPVAAIPKPTTEAATDKPDATTPTDRTTTSDSSTEGTTARATPVAATPEPTTTATTDKPDATTPTDKATTTAITDKPDAITATDKATTAATTYKPDATTATDKATTTPSAAEPTGATPSAPDRSSVKSTPRTVVEDLKVPIVLERVEPDVPAKALNGRRGTVVLKILVNEQGRIARVLVERGIPGSVLESAAINAVLRWRFQPAMKDGQPVRAWTKATFDFSEK